MRRIILVISLIMSVSFAMAQKTDSLPAAKVVTRNIDGTMMMSSKNIIDNLSQSPQFSTLIKLIKAADLTESFTGGTLTFFAPTNQAFEKLPTGMLDTLLLPTHKAGLVSLINYHAVSGRIMSKDMDRMIKSGSGQTTFTTLSGGILTARINENRNIVLTDENGGQSIIARLDILQSNGILHIITNVLPGKVGQ